MVDIKWDHSKFVSETTKKAVDGLEEWGLVEWKPQAVIDSPKLSGIMAGSLGVERDDAQKCIYVGGGGEASAYILKQELDRSLHHPVGKAGFILDTVNDKAPKLSEYVEKHIKK
jgi:hypothetical protein